MPSLPAFVTEGLMRPFYLLGFPLYLPFRRRKSPALRRRNVSAPGSSVDVHSRTPQRWTATRVGNQTLSSPHMRIHRWISVLAAAVALPASLLPSRASAQGITTGAIGGLVTEASGAPLAGVQVQVKNAGSGYVVGALTRENGRYLVPNLEVG